MRAENGKKWVLYFCYDSSFKICCANWVIQVIPMKSLPDVVGLFPNAVVSNTWKKPSCGHTISLNIKLGCREACIKNFICILWHQQIVEKKIQKSKRFSAGDIYDLFFPYPFLASRSALSNIAATSYMWLFKNKLN